MEKIVSVNIVQTDETHIRLEQNIQMPPLDCPPDLILEAYEQTNALMTQLQVNANTSFDDLRYLLHIADSLRGRIQLLLQRAAIKKFGESKLEYVQKKQTVRTESSERAATRNNKTKAVKSTLSAAHKALLNGGGLIVGSCIKCKVVPANLSFSDLQAAVRQHYMESHD